METERILQVFGILKNKKTQSQKPLFRKCPPVCVRIPFLCTNHCREAHCLFSRNIPEKSNLLINCSMTPFLFQAWTLLIYSIKSITLLSYLWISSLLWRVFSPHEGLVASRTPCTTLVEIFFTFWMMVEGCYFPYWLLTHKRLNKRVPSVHACGSQLERTSLLEK